MYRHALLSNQAILGMSGPADPELNQVARALLLRGDLAPIQGTVTWAGRGSGKRCCVCGKSVSGSDVEYEVEEAGRRTPACHLACFVAWQEESRRATTASLPRGQGAGRLSRRPSIG